MGGLVLEDAGDFGLDEVSRVGNNDFKIFKIIFFKMSSLFMPSEIFFHHHPPWNVRMVQDQCRILSAVACQSYSPKPGFRCLRISALFMAVGSCLPLQKG